MVGLVDAGAGPVVIEYLDGLDLLLVAGPDGVRKAAPPAGTTLPRPLDPLTPVTLGHPGTRTGS